MKIVNICAYSSTDVLSHADILQEQPWKNEHFPIRRTPNPIIPEYRRVDGRFSHQICTLKLNTQIWGKNPLLRFENTNNGITLWALTTVRIATPSLTLNLQLCKMCLFEHL